MLFRAFNRTGGISFAVLVKDFLNTHNGGSQVDADYILMSAKRSAHYFISNVALTDYIPQCDFRQPAVPAYRDASAGLCAACGLMELAEIVGGEEKELYRKYGEKLVKHIAEQCCDWNPDRDSIVQQCKVDYHSTGAQHTDLIYGDFFLAEAMLRLMGKDFLIW